MKQEKEIIAKKVEETAILARENDVEKAASILFTIAGALFSIDDDIFATAIKNNFANHNGNKRNHKLGANEELIFDKIIEVEKEARKLGEYNAGSILLTLASSMKLDFVDQLFDFVTKYREDVLQPKCEAENEKRRMTAKILLKELDEVTQLAEETEIYSVVRVLRALEQTIKDDKVYPLAKEVNRFRVEVMQLNKEPAPAMNADKKCVLSLIDTLANLASKLGANAEASILFCLCGSLMSSNDDTLMAEVVYKYMAFQLSSSNEAVHKEEKLT